MGVEKVESGGVERLLIYEFMGLYGRGIILKVCQHVLTFPDPALKVRAIRQRWAAPNECEREYLESHEGGAI